MPSNLSFDGPSRRDSWPPTQMRLRQSVDSEESSMKQDADLTFIDDDPLTYFLEPAPLLDGLDSDDDGDMMDFDAGIEDTKRPPPIVRSVSPSSLNGLARPPQKPLTPPRTPPPLGSPESDFTGDEDDGEDYIHFGTKPSFTLPFSLRDFASLKAKQEQEWRTQTAGSLLSPTSLSTPRPGPSRGRSVTRPGLGRRTRSWSARRTTHAWREPSPDVWSIEEETEEELMSEMENSVAGDDEADKGNGDDRGKSSDIKASKPKKKVRFALPVVEIIP